MNANRNSNEWDVSGESNARALPHGTEESSNYSEDAPERKADAEFVVEIANQQSICVVQEALLCAAVTKILRESEINQAEISIAVVDDKTIHQLNREYLNHDFATDCMSFVLDSSVDHFVGEIIVSAETAASNAKEYGQSLADEMLLYAIHGALHLMGYDDTTEDSAAEMRRAEQIQIDYWAAQQDLPADSSIGEPKS